jgi:signal peptidase II
MKVYSRILIAFILALILDGVTKILALQSLTPHQPAAVIDDFFRLTLGFNTGVAFSMFTNSGRWLLILTPFIIVGLLIWAVTALRSGEFPPTAAWPVGFILGGAVGNYVDRLLDGSVVDFIDVGLGVTRWPSFNLADSFIVVGIFWLILIKMVSPEPQPDADEMAASEVATNDNEQVPGEDFIP